MKRTISEKRVLKQLGISDFRHMTKDKVVKFASMLPYMDPEVAKKALEQFPEYKDLATSIVAEYKEIIVQVFEKNSDSQKAFYDACKSIIESLQKQLEKDSLTPEERRQTEDKMITVAKMIGEKDSENKRFLWRMAATVGGFVIAIGGIAAAILGSNTQLSQNDFDSDSELDSDVDDVIDI